MTSRLLALTMEAHDPGRLARFWGDLLGRTGVADGPGILLPGSATQVGLRFVPGSRQPTGPNRVHLHLTSDEPADQARTVARVLELGGGHVDVGQRPDEGHVVVGDPEGNPFCVIEAGNAYLAGCGLLGELAGDGTRRTGVFWSEVLGWPLVWDQDDETAVQSPSGGTKVAWGGAPLAPKDGRDRQRLRLVADGDPAAEAERLVALGAARFDDHEDGVRLADPDGNEFDLVAMPSAVPPAAAVG